jgi:secreted PhoX family phosphatase
MLGAGTLTTPLAALYSRTAQGASAFGPGFGPLQPVLPLNTEDVLLPGAFDYRGKPLISLPVGFRYWAVSITGQTISDGTLVVGDHDGLACFRGHDGTTILVRNHELSNREVKFGNARGVDVPDALKFDIYANGGTTTLVLDDDGRLLRHYASLDGPTTSVPAARRFGRPG